MFLKSKISFNIIDFVQSFYHMHRFPSCLKCLCVQFFQCEVRGCVSEKLASLILFTHFEIVLI